MTDDVPMSTSADRRCDDPRLTRLAHLYEHLTPASLDELAQAFAPDGRFIDPFNDVGGRPAIRHVFAHMFETLDQPRFEVLATASQGNTGFLLWDLHFRTRGRAPRPHRIHGMSRLTFDEAGLVTLHHDHWDPARQLYEGVPLLGGLMRWIRHRLSAGR